MQLVRVDLGPRSYDIALTAAQPDGVGPFVRERLPQSRLALVVCDRNTEGHGRIVEASLQAVGFRTGLAAIPAGESSKTIAEDPLSYTSGMGVVRSKADILRGMRAQESAPKTTVKSASGPMHARHESTHELAMAKDTYDAEDITVRSFGDFAILNFKLVNL